MDEWNGNSTVFKSYCRGNGKGGTTTELSFEDAAKYSEFGGYLNMGFVDVSYDTPGESDAFCNMAIDNKWKCLILNNPTTKHIHSIWKLPENLKITGGENIRLAVGLNADVHLPVNKPIYVPFRVNGVDRFNNPDFYEPDEIQELPEELFPVKSDINLYDLGEGDGRNQALFRSILVLQSQVSSDVETIRRILTNTNDYIFKEPLPDEELQTVLRDAAFQKPSFYGKKGAFLHNVFGDYLISTYHVKMIEGIAMVCQGGIYNPNQRSLEKTMLKELPMLKASQRREVVEYINVKSDEAYLSSSTMIAFRNGILNVETGELLDFSPDYILTNKIPWDYNPNADDPEAEAFLNRISCDDPMLKATIEESIGYCFYRENFLQKAFFLTGTGSNGKSTFLKVLNRILGKDNVSPIDLNNLNERFSKVHLVGKLANIGDDIGNEEIKDTGFFKKITGENRTVEVERKGKDGFMAEINCKLFFSCNQLPRIGNGDTDAIMRRLIIMPFDAHFDENDPDFDPHITEKLSSQTAIEYFIKAGITGLKRLLQNQKFTKSQRSKDAEDDYKQDIDSVKAYVDDNGVDDLTSGTCADVYRRYCVWCIENNREQLTNRIFGINVKQDYKLTSEPKRINGKPQKCYVKKK